MRYHGNKRLVEPLNKGHIGDSHLSFVERLSSEVQNVLRIWEINIWDFDVSFVEWLFLLCPLLGGSFIGGSIVCSNLVWNILHYTDKSFTSSKIYQLIIELHTIKLKQKKIICNNYYTLQTTPSMNTCNNVTIYNPYTFIHCTIIYS